MVGVAAGAVYNIDKNMKEANDLQAKAQKQAIADSEKQAKAVEMQAQASAAERVKANKTPDAAATMAAQSASARGANGGTMLTGPQGVDPSALSLSKNTLLGM